MNTNVEYEKRLSECRKRIRKLHEEVQREHGIEGESMRKFVKEMCVLRDGVRISTDELYRAFLLFRKIVLNIDGYIPSKTSLSRYLRNEYGIRTAALKVNYGSKNRKAQRFYEGIILK